MGWPLVLPRLLLILNGGLGSWGSARRQEWGGGRQPWHRLAPLLLLCRWNDDEPAAA